MRTPSPLAIAAFSIALGLTGCAKSEPAYEANVQTPLGVVKTKCPAPLAYSKRHGLIAFGCDDGRLPIFHFGSPDSLISEAFLLDAAAIEDSESSLNVGGFRSAGSDGRPASLMSINLLAGTVSVEELEGAGMSTPSRSTPPVTAYWRRAPTAPNMTATGSRLMT